MKTILATASLFLFTGCAVESGHLTEDKANRTAPDPAMEGPASDEHGNPYTITEVKIGADGREEATVYPMTRATEVAAPATGVRTMDWNASKTPCSDSAVRLYDASLATCRASGCNEICFEMTDPNPRRYETGGIDFGHYCVTSACTSSWNSKVRSYWSGSDATGPTVPRLHRRTERAPCVRRRRCRRERHARRT